MVAQAVEGRRREFGTVRHCARAALGELGFAPAPLLPGERGAPRWPDGVVGSMTHCRGYRAAAVARDADVVTIGLDAEPDEPLPSEGVAELIVLPEERVMLRRLAAQQPGICWDRLLFSAKESVYKAWFPLTGCWLDFTEATIRIDPVARSFTARLLVPGPLVAGSRMAGFDGSWLARDGLLVTAVAVHRNSLR
ncbi:4'-phosphopantetheinyl transferase superfamily protein [Kitasatospora kazusensis]|uniref:4'-phosphopantetheinyl transferase superfamily protein n=1 Tax=Kitasatospora kazusensis TaxID=407974 RepID=A0ABP5M2Z0_9ACTN